ncbi:LysM peptidoglycan-binding domain-containing protein [Verrucomicrobiales bacterium]|nr:LysM peptidoglycan-binding domain-containing protein [Verrucomicrobiales bacterium]
MSKNNRQTDSKSDKQSWIDVFARTQRSKSTGEEGWKKDVPNIKLSRAFIVVLILHVVAVGGILAFEMFKSNESNVTASLKSESSNGAVEESVDVREKPESHKSTERLGTNEGFEKYIVQKGDSIRAIADSYKVSRTEILETNLIDEAHPLVSGRILRIPKPKMSISGDDGVVNGDFVSIEELTASSDELDGDLNEVEEVDKKIVEEDDGYQLLSKTDKQPDSKIIPRAIPVSAETEYRSAKVVREIPAESLIASSVPVTKLGIGSMYTIESGDTLYGIARKYNVSIDQILKLNPNVNPRTLGIGRSLRMP